MDPKRTEHQDHHAAAGPLRQRRSAAGWFAALALGVGLAGAGGTAQAADVGVSISISNPGVYGRIDIGRFGSPAVVVAQPVVVAPPRVRREPVYLWVPDAERLHWARYCSRYDACGTPVYFVQDRWYQAHVMPARHVAMRHDRDDHRAAPSHRDDHARGDDHGNDRGHDNRRDRDDRDDRDGGHDRGGPQGHGQSSRH